MYNFTHKKVILETSLSRQLIALLLTISLNQEKKLKQHKMIFCFRLFTLCLQKTGPLQLIWR